MTTIITFGTRGKTHGTAASARSDPSVVCAVFSVVRIIAKLPYGVDYSFTKLGNRPAQPAYWCYVGRRIVDPALRSIWLTRSLGTE
jgi:hypothetical protein